MAISFQRLFYVVGFVFGLFAIMIFAKSVMIPMSMALFLSFILLPVVKKLERLGLSTTLATGLTLFVTFILVAAGVALFSAELIDLSIALSDFSGKIMRSLTEALAYINEHFKVLGEFNRDEVIAQGITWIKSSSGYLVQNTFSSTASFLTGLFSTLIFTFLLLIYRKGLTDAFVAFGKEQHRAQILGMLQNIQRVGKQYVSGMFILIVILGFANSIGLWIIGVDSPFLFGFLAAALSIIPFVGTTLGAILPTLYAFMSFDSLWVPFAVAVMFWAIQVVESNYLNPRIVGQSMQVNALVAILSLLIGGAVWGIAGMILFLPFAAVLKVICTEFTQLRPLAMLISSDISNQESSTHHSIKQWVQKLIAKK